MLPVFFSRLLKNIENQNYEAVTGAAPKLSSRPEGYVDCDWPAPVAVDFLGKLGPSIQGRIGAGP